jgi:hypothetical protein
MMFIKLTLLLRFWSQDCPIDYRDGQDCRPAQPSTPPSQHVVWLAAPSKAGQLTRASFQSLDAPAPLRGQVLRVFEAPPQMRRYLQLQVEFGNSFCAVALAEPSAPVGPLSPLICAEFSKPTNQRHGVSIEQTYEYVERPPSLSQ